VASANCALYCGATIDFVDIDPHTRNIDVDALQEKLIQSAKAKTLPKALVIVHFSGLSCDMQAIHQLTQAYDVILIEDAAHGLGGSYQDNKIGSCQYSEMTVLSFHPVKSITSAEGGAVMTKDPYYYQQLMLFGKHGITRDPSLYQLEDHGPWAYQQIELGYNYRLSDVHAALGLSQLKKLDGFIQKRRELAARYQQALSHLPLKLPVHSQDTQSAWHLYMVELTEHQRRHIYQQLHDKGIGVNVHYIAIHLHPFYQNLGFKVGDFPVSEQFYANALTLPLFPTMSKAQQSAVIRALTEVLT
jgi:dTDP-4-amino-4,6-dideoxygalactose transaminase